MFSANIIMSRSDAACRRAIGALARGPVAAGTFLILLCLVCYLPGLARIPPVDRTEVNFAKAARQMLAEGSVMPPGSEYKGRATKPLGTYWLQMRTADAANAVLGERALRSIVAYRIPSLVGATLATLLLFFLLSPVTGARAALMTAGLYAVTPIVALHAQLALVEAPFQPLLIAAQLAVLRIYAAREGEETAGLALLFWSALGASAVLNALALPILAAITIAGLLVWDRRAVWLLRLRAHWGLPLAAALAAPWLIVPALATGTYPFEGLTFGQVLGAIGGAQQQEWKALPGSFTLALVLGFLPGTLLLAPALRGLWQGRSGPIARFLLVWVAGYLVYLELVSSKPALYMVQFMYPALAAAVGMLLARGGEASSEQLPVPRALVAGSAVLGIIGVPGIAFGLHAFTGSAPAFDAIALAAIFVGVACIAIVAAWQKLANTWVVASVASFALMHVLLFGLVMPRLTTAWPSTHIADAAELTAACAPGPVSIAGFREPSALFAMPKRAEFDEPDELSARLASGGAGLFVVAENSDALVASELSQRGLPPLRKVGCIDSVDLMLGCRAAFGLYVTETAAAAGCKLPERFACREPIATPFKLCRRPKTD